MDFAPGALAMLGADYRVRSLPWTVGIDYRLQTIPYMGIAENGEKPKSPGLEMGPTPMDAGHFFMLSFAYRKEVDRDD